MGPVLRAGPVALHVIVAWLAACKRALAWSPLYMFQILLVCKVAKLSEPCMHWCASSQTVLPWSYKALHGYGNNHKALTSSLHQQHTRQTSLLSSNQTSGLWQSSICMPHTSQLLLYCSACIMLGTSETSDNRPR
jgi:hypothetical protein